ncbi:SH3 domain-containing protein [Mesorhizobium sp. A623]
MRAIFYCGFITALLFAAPTGLRAEASALPIPRFVSLKGSPANLRIGPGVQYDIEWTFVRPGIPLEIYQEYGNWRHVRDWEGTSGWIYGPLLSGRRTAVTAPWDRNNIALRKKPTAESPVTAWLEPEIPIELVRCDGQWCRVAVDTMAGFVKQTRLWGAYPGEVL